MSAIAGFDENGKVEVFPNAEGERRTPSVVLFEEGSREVVVGKFARDAAKSMPARVVDFAKRYMGTNHTWVIDGKKYRPEVISALILKKLKQDAEAYLGGNVEVKRAVITVPAYFDRAQREATRAAGEMAGLEALAIVDEPMAVAIAYGLDKLDKDQTVVVYDLGRYGFNVTVVRIEGGSIRQVSKGGSAELGGKDWDEAIMEWAARQFMDEHGEDPRDDLESYQSLYDSCLLAKEQLSTKQKDVVTCDHAGKRGRYELTLDEFERITKGLLDRTLDILTTAVTKDAGLAWSQVDQVLLVGGSTRMKQVIDAVSKVTGKSREELAAKVEPDLCVAIGAALCAMASQTQPVAACISADHERELELLPSDLTGKLERIEVTQVSSRYLGVAALDPDSGELRFSPIINRNDPLPNSAKKRYRMPEDGMDTIAVTILHSEHQAKLPDEPGVTVLGEDFIRVPPGLPKGSPVTVKFNFQLDGTLIVEVEEDTHGTKMPPQRFRCTNVISIEERQKSA